jgi:hypothetical protein
MRRFRRARIFFFAAVATCAALAASPASQREERPPWWDIKIVVETKGMYKLESRASRCTGTYALAFLWTGSIEKDGEDYLLVHRSCDLTRWDIEETAFSDESVKILSKADIGDKPELKVNYILKKDGGLYFDFIIRGFDVPKSLPSGSFYLNLPASEENADRTAGIDYDDYVKAGSNRIVVEESKILSGAFEKTFDWVWDRLQWLQATEAPVCQSSSHGARVTVSVSPGPKKGSR